MKQKIIWFVYALFFMFGLFMKNFATTETFHALGQTLDFSSATLLYFLQFAFYVVLTAAVLVLRRAKSFAPKKVPAVLGVRAVIVLSVLFLVAVYCLQLGVLPFLSFQALAYNSFLAIALLGGTLVVFAPVMEELFFREIMLDHVIMERGMTRTGGIILGSVLFFLPHIFNGNFSWTILFLGVFVSLLFVYTRRILVAMILHGCINLTGMLFLSGFFPSPGNVTGSILLLSALPLLVASFIILIKTARKAARAPQAGILMTDD